MPRGLFVTGTDTGVGKTELAAALAVWLRGQGIRVRARKPVESGAAMGADGGLMPADATLLQRAAGGVDPLPRVCPHPLPAPLSPQRAAALAGLRLSLDALDAACRHDLKDGDFLLVEGAGGFCSPLTGDGVNADLAQRLGLPVLVVIGDRLGCLNHALLTLEAAHHRGLTVAALVLNRYQRSGGMDNARDLSHWCGLPQLTVPEIAGDAPWQRVPTATLARLGALVTLAAKQSAGAE